MDKTPCKFYLKSYTVSNLIHLLSFYIINYLPFYVGVSVKNILEFCIKMTTLSITSLTSTDDRFDIRKFREFMDDYITRNP